MKKMFMVAWCLACVVLVSLQAVAADKPIVLRYAHMNAPTSVAGKQATMFAELVAQKTNGAVKIDVFPSSQLGTLQEMAEQVSTGTVAFHHNTMAGIGSLYQDFGALDTPYLYRDVEHLMTVANPASPIMQKLSAELVKAKGVRVLYTFYFGTRELTANKEVKTPKDLEGVKIRAIPFPIYMTAVEGMGAVATPVDWSEVPTALATGTVAGQENPFDVIWSAKLYEIQKYLMLTNHIMGAECVVANEEVFSGLPEAIQKQILEAAAEVSVQATKMTQDLEAQQLADLKAKGMTVIGAEEGLDVEAFKASVQAAIEKKFGEQYGELYKQIKEMK